MGLSLIPAFGTVYQRLTLPESIRYKKTQNLRKENSPGASDEEIAEVKRQQESKSDVRVSSTSSTSASINKELRGSTEYQNDTAAPPEVVVKKKAHFKDFARYFSEWRHFKILLGTTMCWFLLDIAFYGINLNQNVVLQQIGFDGSSGTPWERLFKISTGNIIITALGFVPGYYASILTIEKLGRKWIQIQGFLVTALFRKFPPFF